MAPREYCPACYMHLGTSLTSCACGWKMLDPMPRQDLELPPPVGFVLRAEHERLMAERDAEIARLRKAISDIANWMDDPEGREHIGAVRGARSIARAADIRALKVENIPG